MTAGPAERGFGDQPPPNGGEVQPTFRAQAEPEMPSTVLPHQVPYGNASTALAAGAAAVDEATFAAQRLHQEISQELLDHREWLRGVIYGEGYREPDLSTLDSDTQVRYYSARSKPGFTFRVGPKALFRWCFGKARLDFHRREGRQPEPVGELPEPRPATEESEADRVLQREAIKAFLETHLPDEEERAVYLLAHGWTGEPMTQTAIAEKLDIDRKTVAKRLKRAEKHLKSLPAEMLDALR
ncbi:sigma-70 family RNA polymerase sigma factor [Streptomyces marianii]|uniref:Sigma-70 family RNA polymerase sigma factor n=1 Tax=Streptomyces marianii TaxID=1817406 RepID=A0A5R9ED10_9ACTN|nr:sigma-70 family RNA polymerase sigma factor [Streptomyces marianii]TLQ47896.1 sigma-70 family RNA polymerase sigma factor [Streptomyces marianii]